MYVIEENERLKRKLKEAEARVRELEAERNAERLIRLMNEQEMHKADAELGKLRALVADANRRAKAYEDHCNKGATEVAFLRKNGVMANSKVFSVNTADVEALEQWGRDLTALEKALAPAQPAARGTAEERLAAARDALEAYEAACHGSIDEHDAFVELRAVLASAQPAGPAEHFAGGMPRVGRKQARNIYIGDDYIGVAFREQDARLIVTALSEYAKPPSDRVAAFRYAIGVDPGTPDPTPLAGQAEELVLDAAEVVRDAYHLTVHSPAGIEHRRLSARQLLDMALCALGRPFTADGADQRLESVRHRVLQSPELMQLGVGTERCARCGGFTQNPGQDELCFDCEERVAEAVSKLAEPKAEERGGASHVEHDFPAGDLADAKCTRCGIEPIEYHHSPLPPCKPHDGGAGR